MDLSLTQLTFRDFVPETLRNDYLEGKCKEIGEFYIKIREFLIKTVQKLNQTRAFIMLTVLY